MSDYSLESKAVPAIEVLRSMLESRSKQVVLATEQLLQELDQEHSNVLALTRAAEQHVAQLQSELTNILPAGEPESVKGKKDAFLSFLSQLVQTGSGNLQLLETAQKKSSELTQRAEEVADKRKAAKYALAEISGSVSDLESLSISDELHVLAESVFPPALFEQWVWESLNQGEFKFYRLLRLGVASLKERLVEATYQVSQNLSVAELLELSKLVQQHGPRGYLLAEPFIRVREKHFELAQILMQLRLVMHVIRRVSGEESYTLSLPEVIESGIDLDFISTHNKQVLGPEFLSEFFPAGYGIPLEKVALFLFYTGYHQIPVADLKQLVVHDLKLQADRDYFIFIKDDEEHVVLSQAGFVALFSQLETHISYAENSFKKQRYGTAQRLVPTEATGELVVSRRLLSRVFTEVKSLGYVLPTVEHIDEQPLLSSSLWVEPTYPDEAQRRSFMAAGYIPHYLLKWCFSELPNMSELVDKYGAEGIQISEFATYLHIDLVNRIKQDYVMFPQYQQLLDPEATGEIEIARFLELLRNPYKENRRVLLLSNLFATHDDGSFVYNSLPQLTATIVNDEQVNPLSHLMAYNYGRNVKLSFADQLTQLSFQLGTSDVSIALNEIVKFIESSDFSQDSEVRELLAQLQNLVVECQGMKVESFINTYINRFRFSKSRRIEVVQTFLQRRGVSKSLEELIEALATLEAESGTELHYTTPSGNVFISPGVQTLLRNHFLQTGGKKKAPAASQAEIDQVVSDDLSEAQDLALAEQEHPLRLAVLEMDIDLIKNTLQSFQANAESAINFLAVRMDFVTESRHENNFERVELAMRAALYEGAEADAGSIAENWADIYFSDNPYREGYLHAIYQLFNAQLRLGKVRTLHEVLACNWLFSVMTGDENAAGTVSIMQELLLLYGDPIWFRHAFSGDAAAEELVTQLFEVLTAPELKQVTGAVSKKRASSRRKAPEKKVQSEPQKTLRERAEEEVFEVLPKVDVNLQALYGQLFEISSRSHEVKTNGPAAQGMLLVLYKLIKAIRESDTEAVEYIQIAISDVVLDDAWLSGLLQELMALPSESSFESWTELHQSYLKNSETNTITTESLLMNVLVDGTSTEAQFIESRRLLAERLESPNHEIVMQVEAGLQEWLLHVLNKKIDNSQIKENIGQFINALEAVIRQLGYDTNANDYHREVIAAMNQDEGPNVNSIQRVRVGRGEFYIYAWPTLERGHWKLHIEVCKNY